MFGLTIYCTNVDLKLLHCPATLETYFCSIIHIDCTLQTSTSSKLRCLLYKIPSVKQNHDLYSNSLLRDWEHKWESTEVFTVLVTVFYCILPFTVVWVGFFYKLLLNICALVISSSPKLILEAKSPELDKIMSNFHDANVKILACFMWWIMLSI